MVTAAEQKGLGTLGRGMRPDLLPTVGAPEPAVLNASMRFTVSKYHSRFAWQLRL